MSRPSHGTLRERRSMPAAVTLRFGQAVDFSWDRAQHSPKPFVRTADPDAIIAPRVRGYQSVRFDPLAIRHGIAEFVDSRMEAEDGLRELRQGEQLMRLTDASQRVEAEGDEVLRQ